MELEALYSAVLHTSTIYHKVAHLCFKKKEKLDIQINEGALDFIRVVVLVSHHGFKQWRQLNNNDIGVFDPVMAYFYYPCFYH